MPSALPRISLVVSRDQHRLLKRLGALTGRSQAALVGDCLNAFIPSLTVQLALLEAYAELNEAGEPEAAYEAMETAVHALDLASIVQLDQLDEVRGKIDGAMAEMRASITAGKGGSVGVAGAAALARVHQ